MSVLGWLKQKILGGAPQRDVSQLETSSESLDVLKEIVDTSGGPLKPQHRRRALRDKRLLPKPLAPPIRLTKRKRILASRDAARWFSKTFLTRNRGLRDLVTDEDQLLRLGLPVWRHEDEVANALGLAPGQLRHFSIHREKERAPHYVTFAIRKRSGGERLIMAPKRRLKAVQRRLLEMLVQKLPVTDHAHGFRKGRSIRSGAEPHVGRRVVVHLDLQDFFPTVTAARVRGYLIACGYGYPVATALAVLMTEAQRQPVAVDDEVFHVPVGPRHCVQGAPTSPGLCNAIVAKLDRRLGGLAKKFAVAYTRYADDLTFSGELDPGTTGRLLHHAARIIRDEGFATNVKKTRVMHRGGAQQVTGVTVNQVLGLSRRERRRLRAAVHHVAKGKPIEPATAVRGKLAYLAMLNQTQADRLLQLWNRWTLGTPVTATAPAVPTPPMPREFETTVGTREEPAQPELFAGRYFEWVEEGVAKFWAVDVIHNEVIVRFGRVGTRGHEQRKTFTSAGAAQRERDRLIESKQAKGYVEKPRPEP